jgi:hypothetical protein
MDKKTRRDDVARKKSGKAQKKMAGYREIHQSL